MTDFEQLGVWKLFTEAHACAGRSWTGNRVTCRDWFQLTLKEGLTVFRDQARR